MTALHPNQQATGLAPASVIRDAPKRRIPGAAPAAEVHAGAQLGATLIASGLILVAVLIGGWAGIPVAVLAFAIFAGALLPDVLGARFDAARAREDDEEAADA